MAELAAILQKRLAAVEPEGARHIVEVQAAGPTVESQAVRRDGRGSTAAASSGSGADRIIDSVSTAEVEVAGSVRIIDSVGTMEVQVAGIAGQLCSLTLPSTATIDEAKSKIEEATGVPVEEQKLLSASTELHSNESVAAANPSDHSSLRLTMVRFDHEKAGWLSDIQSRKLTLEDLPPRAQADEDVVLAAFEHAGGMQLFHASDNLKSNRDIVIAAVSSDGRALMHAPEEFHADREVVLAAVKNRGGAMSYASPELKDSREFVLAAVAQGGLALEYAAEHLQEDEEVALTAILQDGRALEFAPSEFQSDRQKVLAAIESHGGAYQYADDEFRRDPEIIRAALLQLGLLPVRNDEDRDRALGHELEEMIASATDGDDSRLCSFIGMSPEERQWMLLFKYG